MTSSHTENASEKRVPCHEDVGFGFWCMREKGHDGFHTWDPKRLLGEDPVTDDQRNDAIPHGHAMLPNDSHPGPGCSCRECLSAYPEKP